LLGAAFGGALRAAAQPALGAGGGGSAGAVERRRRSAASRRSGAVARIFLASWETGDEPTSREAPGHDSVQLVPITPISRTGLWYL